MISIEWGSVILGEWWAGGGHVYGMQLKKMEKLDICFGSKVGTLLFFGPKQALYFIDSAQIWEK